METLYLSKLVLPLAFAYFYAELNILHTHYERIIDKMQQTAFEKRISAYMCHSQIYLDLAVYTGTNGRGRAKHFLGNVLEKRV